MTALLADVAPAVPVKPRRRPGRGMTSGRPASRPTGGPRQATGWVALDSLALADDTAVMAEAAPLGAEESAPLAVVIPFPRRDVVLEDCPPEPEVPARYEWTPRGLRVILGAVVVTVTIMVTTLVSAFVAVPDTPLQPGEGSAAIAAQAVPGAVGGAR